MILIDELWVCRVAPWLGIEVKTNHDVGPDELIDSPCPPADFCCAIEKSPGFLAEILFVSGNTLSESDAIAAFSSWAEVREVDGVRFRGSRTPGRRALPGAVPKSSPQ